MERVSYFVFLVVTVHLSSLPFDVEERVKMPYMSRAEIGDLASGTANPTWGSLTRQPSYGDYMDCCVSVQFGSDGQIISDSHGSCSVTVKK